LLDDVVCCSLLACREVKNGGVHKWHGDIVSYKQHLKQNMEALEKRKDLA
jgi:hypothetical protein